MKCLCVGPRSPTQRAKIVQQRANVTKLIPLGSGKGLTTASLGKSIPKTPRENHLETVNIESNGKSRLKRTTGSTLLARKPTNLLKEAAFKVLAYALNR